MAPSLSPSQRYSRLLHREGAIAQELRRMESKLQRTPNVVGYGVGPKVRNGRRVADCAAIFFVSQKISTVRLSRRARLPRSIRLDQIRVATDVVQVSPLQRNQQNPQPEPGNPAANDERKRNPIPMGIDIGVCRLGAAAAENAGTAGAVVKSRTTSEHYILSAGHVYKNVDNDVIQPHDGKNKAKPIVGAPPNRRDNIGNVHKVANWRPQSAAAGAVGPVIVSAEIIDAGIAECDAATASIIGIGRPDEPVKPTLTLYCEKSGAKTGVTFGTIEYTSITAFNDFASTTKLAQPIDEFIRGLFFIKPDISVVTAFCDKGDSGALIVAGDGDPGHPGKRFGKKLTEEFKKLFIEDGRNNTYKELEFKVRLDRAALGLLIAKTTVIILGAPNPQGQFGVGQELQLALDALNVDLDLTV